MPRDPDRRVRVLKFIRNFIQEHGCPPTVREIEKGCGLASHRPVQYHLEALEREGLIERIPHRSRGIQLVGENPGSFGVPLLGTIAAGEPIPVPSEETWEPAALEMVDVPQNLIKSKKQGYALKVKGTSMIDALVDDGDIVILEPTTIAEDGQMVAAWLKDRQEATLKKLYRDAGRIRLQPANPTMAPIYVNDDEIEVQGRVIAVLRKLQ